MKDMDLSASSPRPRGRFPSSRRHHDRHGRGQISTNLLPTLPGWKTRREQFDQLIRKTVARMSLTYPEVNSIEYAVEEVPPSTPAPWEEHDISLARLFPRDRIRGLNDRIVLYRQPILHRCDQEELPDFLALLLAERISHVLKLNPEDLLF